MSSILKALKKVEEEKNARRNTQPLAGEVVKPRRGRTATRRWTIPAALAAVALVAVLGTYGAMGGFSSAKPAQPNGAGQAVGKVPAPVTEQVQSITIPADGAPAAKTDAPYTGQKSVAPLSEPRSPATGRLFVAADRRPAPPAIKPASVPAASILPTAPAVAVRRQPDPIVRTTNGSVAIHDSHAEFKVNGIAWQKESSSRLAVVNGVAVTQGAMVDGAKVVEILPDRVRLSQGGRTFEVVLGRINAYR